MSRQSELILSLVRSAEGHLTAEQVYDRARLTIPNISMGTVYRNLGRMAEAGEIRRIAVADGPDRFDKTLREHGHLICVACGRVEDLPTSLLAGLEKRLGTEVLSCELTVRYVCPRCRKIENVTGFAGSR